MKFALILIILAHGVIHLFGFLKAFEIIQFKGLTEYISKPTGLIWLLAFILFLTTGLLYLLKNEYWSLCGLLAVLISQALTFIYWQDAKVGSLPNFVILISCVLALGNLMFNKKINKELSATFQSMNAPGINEGSALKPPQLPAVVQLWLEKSGALKSPPIQNCHLTQSLLIKMKPEQKDWYQANAEQFFTIDPPAFNWSVDVDMHPLMPIKGRDKFENGKGAMFIKMYSIFPIVSAKENTKIDEGALQRYLAEIIWFPTAALSPYISWEAVNENSARATMSFKGTTGSGLFKFTETGDVENFAAMRFKDSDANAERKEWRIEVLKTVVKNSVRIPVHSRVIWKLDDGHWTWLQVEIEAIEYNVDRAVMMH